MDTNLNIPVQKKLVSVEILHLDELGYGPQGKHTRREWRAECLDNLLAGKDQFEAWQASWKDKINKDSPKVSLAVELTYDDGTNEEILNEHYQTKAPTTLDFVAFTFVSNVNVNDFMFTSDANFNCATFTRGANFENATFSGHANFDNTTISGGAIFDSAVFGNVSFNKSKFIGTHLSFSKTTFEEKVFFRAVLFPQQPTSSNNMSFESAKFKSGVEFSDCSITCLSYFTDAHIYHGAKFKNVIFKENCTFNRANFFPKWGNTARTRYTGLGADFTKTQFESDVDFSECVFDIPAYFIETQFNGDVAFDYVEFNCDVRFFSTKFLGGSFFNDTKFTGEGAKRLGQMKRMAEDNGHTDTALNFNALELEHKANADDAGFWFKLLTKSYGIFSDYGRSFTRPLCCYVVLLIATFCIALAQAEYFSVKDCKRFNGQIFTNLNRKQIECEPVILKNGDSNGTMTGWRAAGEYMLYRAVGVLDFADSDKKTTDVANRLFGQDHEPWWMRIYGILKAIASTALLFLAALGLRNKYRIK
jgi:uncharacterized protein YjbI with pentapeptide repeats